ncbi:hypothetical protein ABKV19_025932 [Rosa sericea]
MEFKRIYEGTYLTRNQKQPLYCASLVDWMGARIVAAILWPLHVLGTKLVYSKIHSAIGISKIAHLKFIFQTLLHYVPAGRVVVLDLFAEVKL